MATISVKFQYSISASKKAALFQIFVPFHLNKILNLKTAVESTVLYNGFIWHIIVLKQEDKLGDLVYAKKWNL